ncbi:MAG: TcpQ domain-containing protein [Rhodospirillales bacterium]|nr:TcpQ domain-containing protein [Rhodospirillales bacterium]
MLLAALTKPAKLSAPKRAPRLILTVALSGAAFLAALPTAHAGFEWTPSPQTKSGIQNPGQADLMPAVKAPLPPVTTQPLSAPVPRMPIPSASAPAKTADVPDIDLAPLKTSRQSRLAALKFAKATPPSPPVVSLKRESETPDFAPPAKVTPASARSASPALLPEDMAPITGFGRDVPLALAMRQVVPANYGFSFAEGVDPGQRVSWTGGKPWNEALEVALRPHGLTVVLAPNAVRVEPISPMTPPPVAQQQGQNGLPRMPAALAPRSTMKDVDTESLPNPIPAAKTAPASGAPTALISAPAPELKTEPPSAFLDMPPVSRHEKKPLPVTTQPSTPATNPMPVAPIPAAISSAQTISSPLHTGRRDVSAVPFDMNSVREWSAPAGTTLRRVLTDWSQQAGVQLHWSSQFDYPIQTGVRVTATYQKAVEMVLDGLRDAKPRPLARLHPNLPAGPAVLILQTQNVIN